MRAETFICSTVYLFLHLTSAVGFATCLLYINDNILPLCCFAFLFYNTFWMLFQLCIHLKTFGQREKKYIDISGNYALYSAMYFCIIHILQLTLSFMCVIAMSCS